MIKSIVDTIITNANNDGIEVSDEGNIVMQILGFNSLHAHGAYSQPGLVACINTEVILLNPVFNLSIKTPNAHTLKVLLHELAHASGHSTRLNRTGVAGMHSFFKDHQLVIDHRIWREIIAFEEYIAESVANLIMKSLNAFDSNAETHSDIYISTYSYIINSSNRDLINSQIDQAMEYVLKHYVNNQNNIKKAA